MKTLKHQKLPNNWNQREKLRDKGQFWTPSWIANAMIAYVAKEAQIVFDPGVGKGAFYTALKKFNRKIKFYGTDIDPEIIKEAKLEGIFDKNCEIEVRDFILNPPQKLFEAIVANPPYIRHHRISPEIKKRFQALGLQIIGDTLDGRAGMHIYFFVQALNLLKEEGRLAFIMPADTCEGVFSKKLWNWIAKKFCIEGVITFDHKATPFPGVDTNAVIFLISNKKPRTKMKWVRCLQRNNAELTRLLKNNISGNNYESLAVYERSLDEALATGLSREERLNQDYKFRLNNFARVMRGIATGANEFFFLTKKRARELELPENFFISAIGRTRDADGGYITSETITKLEEKGRPTCLFFPNGVIWEKMPEAVKKYILEGEKLGFPGRALISTRRPWYKMEIREAPTFLFSYLGRRNARFIKNEAGIVPLTGFLCIYPRSNDKDYIEKLWKILQHPDTISNLKMVGKSYGSGAIKVEPRSLEQLPINSEIVEKFGLKPFENKLTLF
jgi:adenine-specific DNA-methyltransferase